MASSNVSISGLKELDVILKTLPVNIEKNVMRGAIRAGLNEIKTEAKSQLASGGHVKSGALQRSVRVGFARKSEKYGWVRGHVKAGDKKAWYAHLIEFGTGSFYSGKGTKSKRAPYEIKPKGKKSLFFAGLMKELVIHPGIRPSPFMRKAFDSKSAASIKAFADYMEKRIPKEVKKASR
jgi:HK97 gp10 family phage protein